MNINNARVNGKIVNISVENKKIADITDKKLSNAFDARGKSLFPGLIDVHTHGCVGIDTMDADFEKMCAFHAAHGTTSFLPTTMTMDFESLNKVCSAKTDFAGAEILGFHLEGPYISKKYKGAQNEKFIRNPDINEINSLKNVKMITLAPELSGSEDFIKAVSQKTVVSIGHTDCDYKTAIKAIEAGALCLTHTFNAMPPLLHRNPGPIGAAVEKNIYAQLICDGFHVEKPVVLAAYRMFGADKLVLISDAIRCAGMPDGVYESGGLDVYLKDGAARLKDGTIAGSCATLFDCVKTAVSFGIPLDNAVKMASENPAKMLGIKKGKIEEGYDADFILLDSLNLEKVFIGGEIIETH